MARPEIRRNSLVIMEVDDRVVPGVVADDDIHNPIRLVQVSGGITGVLADDLELTDREIFEKAIYLEGSLRDDSYDMAIASIAANIGG
jgi:hypothetical protein